MSIEHSPPSTFILRELHDVAVPDSVSWLPQTVGWKVLLIFALSGAAFGLFIWAQSWWNSRYRREALSLLACIDADNDHAMLDTFIVLKGVLRYLEPRHAALANQAFLVQLNAYSSGRNFVDTHLAQTWLQSLENPNVELTFTQKQDVLELAKQWVNHHVFVRTENVCDSESVGGNDA